ncbi:hypothetical protein B296_00053475 [Ensete ventricosum]|uniref:Uncharacterized protein n=1 Tax=Ensete ventricosum TaxID=4639 RepID=A0A426XW34_ENSVE|nr:hypothetical protein B296_00053475 [Ensete ventricosum]
MVTRRGVSTYGRAPPHPPIGAATHGQATYKGCRLQLGPLQGRLHAAKVRLLMGQVATCNNGGACRQAAYSGGRLRHDTRRQVACGQR